MRFNRTLILMAALAVATAAHAGPSGSSGGRSSGGGGSSGGKSSSTSTSSSGKSAASPSRGTGGTSSTGAAGRSGYRAANAPGQRPINRQNTAQGQQRRSLIPTSGAQPSQHVTEIIRERESSGPGWLGTAFLISLLSRHDLSSSDKSWIEGRINSIRAEEDSDASEPPALLPAAHPKIAYTFKGIDAPLRVGEAASVSVSALDNGKPVDVSCDHPAATTQNGRVEIAWTPDVPGVTLLTCKAGERTERRLVRVIDKGAS